MPLPGCPAPPGLPRPRPVLNRRPGHPTLPRQGSGRPWRCGRRRRAVRFSSAADLPARPARPPPGVHAMQEFALAMLRHVLTGAGAVLVAKGIADEGTTQAIVGGVVAATSVGWAAWTKRAALKPAGP